MTPTNRWLLTAIVGGYLLVSLAHGVAHSAVPVELTALQIAVVLIVVTAIPLVSLWWVWTGRDRFGVPLYAAAMVGGLLFGLYFHFLVANPDNVGSVNGPWAAEFELTAVLIALTSFAGSGHGLWLLARRRAGNPGGSKTPDER